MRVCHVSPHLPPDQAANALLPASLGEWTRQSGGQVVFIAHEPSQGGQLLPALSGAVHSVPRRERAGLRRWLRLDALSMSRRVAHTLDETAADADIIHLHSNGLIVEAAAAWARRRRRPHLLTLYGTEIWHYRPRRPIDPWTRAYHGAGAVTFYSGRLMEKARTLGLARPAMHVIYPAVGERFAPHDDRARAELRAALGILEPRVVLNVKRLHELAGQDSLIDGFARAVGQRADTRLVICGTGPLREELGRLARQRGIGDRVTFTGLVENDLVARYAAAADVFVLPSLLEAMPTVALEALASGTPVISADHPGGLELHELFGADVRIVPRRNPTALAEAIEAALAHPTRVHPVTLDIIRTRFSPAAVWAAYDRTYAQVTASGAAVAGR